MNIVKIWIKSKYPFLNLLIYTSNVVKMFNCASDGWMDICFVYVLQKGSLSIIVVVDYFDCSNHHGQGCHQLEKSNKRKVFFKLSDKSGNFMQLLIFFYKSRDFQKILNPSCSQPWWRFCKICAYIRHSNTFPKYISLEIDTNCVGSIGNPPPPPPPPPPPRRPGGRLNKKDGRLTFNMEIAIRR